jgi:hypothetical protein
MTGGTVDGNQAGTDGGGLFVESGNATIGSRSSVSNNQALNGTGGGLYVSSGDTTLARSRVDDNQARDVGGINEAKGNVRVVSGSEVNGNSSTALLDVSAGDFGGGGIATGIGNVFVSQSQISHNHSVGMYSSGIVVGLGGVTVTSGSRVDGNSNNGPGGGIAANFGGVVTVSGGSQVDQNTGSGLGGGIVNFAGSMGGVRILGHSEVNDNTLTNGESLGQALEVFLEVLAGSLNLDFTTATGGTSTTMLAAGIAQFEQDATTNAEPGTSPPEPPGVLVAGGGIGTLLGSTITVAGSSEVDGNFSGATVSGGNPNTVGIGGGITAVLGSIMIQGSHVDGNTSVGNGGGIWNRGPLTVVASTLASNNASGSAPGSLGGGLFNFSGGTTSLLHSTLRANRSGFGGGVYNLGTLKLAGSTVIGNQATVRGGGIIDRGQLTLVRSRVVANSPDNIDTPT